MKHEGQIESIRTRLLNLSRASGETFDYVLARYGIERVLYRLGKSEVADRFVLKGATLFHVWNQKLHRPTRDLDLLGSGPDDLESLRNVILAIIRIPCPEDGISFDEDSLSVAPIRDDMDYGGVRAKFRAMLGNVRIPMRALGSAMNLIRRGHHANNASAWRHQLFADLAALAERHMDEDGDHDGGRRAIRKLIKALKNALAG